ncbi:MAG: hypothetical protein RR356_00065 [Bacteroidales bacterium]
MQKQGIKVDKMRVNKIMRENHLLSSYRINIERKSKSKHDGKIITDQPDIIGEQMEKSSLPKKMVGAGYLL